MKLDRDIYLAIPPTLMAEIRAAAEEEPRPASAVLRDALERCLAQSRKVAARRPSKRLPAEAAAHLRAAREGRVLPEGVTIRELMTHGRA